MEHPALRHNLRALNDLLGLEDRRFFVRELGIGGAEFVSYLVGDRVPSQAKLEAIGRFFGLDTDSLRHVRLDELSLQRAQQRLRRNLREHQDNGTLWQDVG